MQTRLLLVVALTLTCCFAQVWKHNDSYKYKLISTTIRTNVLNDSCALLVSEYLDVSFKKAGEAVKMTRTLPKYIVEEGHAIRVNDVILKQILNGTELPSQVNVTWDKIDEREGGPIDMDIIAVSGGVRLQLTYSLLGYRVNLTPQNDRVSYSFQTDAEIEQMNFTIYFTPSNTSQSWLSPYWSKLDSSWMWIENKDALDATKGWVVQAFIPASEYCDYVENETPLRLGLGISLPIAAALLILTILLIEFALDKIHNFRKNRPEFYPSTGASFRVHK
jgi:hypothetical protein